MKIQTRLIKIGISMWFIAGFAGCDRTGPTASAGQKVDAAGENPDRQSEMTRTAIDDAEITARVNTAIYAAPGLKSLKINVETHKGAVTLRGSTDSLTSSDRAKMLAGTVTGVKEVENRLVFEN